MKKLILTGVVAIVAAFSNPVEAQISVNFNIGSNPQYVPVRYVNTGYYYGAAPRTVYVNRVYKVKNNRHNYYRPVKTRYIRRPVVYSRPFYSDNRGRGHSYHKIKAHKPFGRMDRKGGHKGRR
jgi:hypothetical protein